MFIDDAGLRLVASALAAVSLVTNMVDQIRVVMAESGHGPASLVLILAREIIVLVRQVHLPHGRQFKIEHHFPSAIFNRPTSSGYVERELLEPLPIDVLFEHQSGGDAIAGDASDAASSDQSHLTDESVDELQVVAADSDRLTSEKENGQKRQQMHVEQMTDRCC